MRSFVNSTVIVLGIGLAISVLFVSFIESSRSPGDHNETSTPADLDLQGETDGLSRSDVAEQQYILEDSEKEAIPVWSEPPEVMESILLDRLAEIGGGNILSISSYHCDESRCEVQYLTNRRFSVQGWFQHFARPPFEFNWGNSGKCKNGLCQREMFLETKVEPTQEEYDAAHKRLAESLRQTAARRVPPDDIYAPPAALNAQFSVDNMNLSLTVENICSIDCPLDLQQVIYTSVPDGQTCAGIDSTEETMLVRSADGAFQERQFCIPNLLRDF